jgi:homoserine kinase
MSRGAGAGEATAFAPATVANVAVGFDILGYAVESVGDTATVTVTDDPTVTVSGITDAAGASLEGEIPIDPERNTATVGLIRLRADLGLRHGFRVALRKGIALGSGMGGSAASAVAALVAANSLLERPLPEETLIGYALLGERVASGTAHPDNATPCLFGGLTLVTSVSPYHYVRLPVPPEILTVLVHPHTRLDTRRARRVLRPDVPLADCVRQSAALAGFVAGCYANDTKLLGECLRDELIEPQRAALIPGFAEVKAAAMAAGALGASISGAGPAVFAWVTSADAAECVRAAMVGAFAEYGGAECDSWVSPVCPRGARIV